jgi:hypothetical protein
LLPGHRAPLQRAKPQAEGLSRSEWLFEDRRRASRQRSPSRGSSRVQQVTSTRVSATTTGRSNLNVLCRDLSNTARSANMCVVVRERQWCVRARRPVAARSAVRRPSSCCNEQTHSACLSPPSCCRPGRAQRTELRELNPRRRHQIRQSPQVARRVVASLRGEHDGSGLTSTSGML